MLLDPATTAIVGSGALALVSWVGIFIRKFARDKLETARDRAEGNLIEDLIKQRDDARLERDTISQELQKLGEDADACLTQVRDLMVKEQHLRIQNQMLSHLLEKLGEALDQSKSELEKALKDKAG